MAEKTKTIDFLSYVIYKINIVHAYKCAKINYGMKNNAY